MSKPKKKSKPQPKLYASFDLVKYDDSHIVHGMHANVFVNGTVNCVREEFEENENDACAKAVYELKLVGYLEKGATFIPK